jgi:hypothetical protein
LVIKALDPDWIQIQIGIQPNMLDPDPDEMNADPQPCYREPLLAALTPWWQFLAALLPSDSAAGIFAQMSRAAVEKYFLSCLSAAGSTTAVSTTAGSTTTAVLLARLFGADTSRLLPCIQHAVFVRGLGGDDQASQYLKGCVHGRNNYKDTKP